MANDKRVARGHLFMATVYLVAALASLAAFALAQVGWVASLPNLYWLRLHLITIGVLVQAIVGVLPLLLARGGAPAPLPAARWAVFALLNAGLLALITGQVLGVPVLRTGGAFTLLAALSLWYALVARMARAAPRRRAPGWAFYLAAPGYLLLGVLMALTLIEGWPAPVGYQAVKESHIHLNIFGFTGLMLAGVASELLPALYGRPLARPGWTRPLFALMAGGAFALWLGPYIGVLPIMGAGLLVYVAGVLGVLARLLVTLRRPSPAPTRHGLWFLASYAWIAAPALATLAFVALGTGRVPLARLELGVTQGLVYGWILTIILAFLPVAGAQMLAGTWSKPLAASGDAPRGLALMNAAVAVVWLASIALPWAQARPWVAGASALVVLAALPGVARLAAMLRATCPPHGGRAVQP